MRLAAAGLAISILAAPARAEEPAGVRWEADLEAALARAAAEGRPVLIAVNALEGESANEGAASRVYPSAPWGNATREFVCLVANGESHTGEDGLCRRYGQIPCAAHRAVLRYVIRRFAPDGTLISPQHFILEPDGALAWRREFWGPDLVPSFLEAHLSLLAPYRAYAHAGAVRRDRIRELETCAEPEAEARARAWLGTEDGLAAAGVLQAIDFAAPGRRLLLIRALEAAPATQRPVVTMAAHEASLDPDAVPEEALAYARALMPTDRAGAVRVLARIAVRTQDAGLRVRALRLWTGAEPSSPGWGPNRLPEAERPALEEVLLLLADPRAGETPSSLSPAWSLRLARARVRAGAASRAFPPLREALRGDPTPGVLRGALLEAGTAEVRAHAGAIADVLLNRPEARLRNAAALALLGAGRDAEGRVVEAILEALADPIEGPDVRREAVRRLGADPGHNPRVWQEALARALGGER